jgi:hypothetical protein
MKELNRFRQFLNENEVLDRYDKASKKLFDMTWDEVQRENDPRMKQDVHDEVQKDDDLDYIDDVQENQSSSQEFYEVEFVEMDGNEVTRDFRHFTDENESKQFFNDLKGNPETVRIERTELFKGDGKNYLGGSEGRDRFVNKEPEMHRLFLNSRLGDKRFVDEDYFVYMKRKKQARNEFLQDKETSLALNEGSINESLEALISKAKKIQSFVDKQGKEDGYEGGAHSPVGGVLTALKVAGGPGFDGDEKLKGYYTRKLSKAIDTQLQKKYMKGFLNEFDDKFTEYNNNELAAYVKNNPKDKEAAKELHKRAQGIKALSRTDEGFLDLKENMPKAIIMRQIRDAEEILDSGEADGMPLDNETEMLVRQELERLKKMAGGDKKEKTMKFLKSKKSYRENLSLEEIYKDIMEVDEEEEKIRKKYDGMKRPSQDEVNDAFEKFERETHYLNNKPVSKWDAADMSNWKVILRKGGKIN